MEHLEIMPISTRVVCLNAPYLKSLCVFEALSRTLGCYYNHHRSQVVSCKATVRLPTPKIVRVRGHTSHVHTPFDIPTLHTNIQMGTYLIFYLKDWSEIYKCILILNGIEKVPRTTVPPKVLLERIPNPQNFDQEKNLVNDSFNIQGVSRVQDPAHSNPRSSEKLDNANTLPKSHHILDNVPIKEKAKIFGTVHHTKSTPQLCQSQKKEYPPKPPEGDITIVGKQDNNRDMPKPCQSIIINMDQSEEITTLLNDDNEDDTDSSSDTSDDLHKVVRKRLSIDITSLLQPFPNNNMLVLLLRPAEESQAWQFLSACIKVTHYSTKALVTEGSGTIKKALTRTRPIYFCKNGNAQRL